MAGGAGRREPSLAQLLASRTPPAPAGRSEGARHCWVADPPNHPGRWPGLLLAWRRTPGGAWEAWVVFAATDPDGRPTLIEAWLPADILHPAVPPAPSPPRSGRP